MAKSAVAVVGLGIMGAGIAQNILKAGYPLSVYNRTPAKAEPLAAQGAHVAATPREAVVNADVIISMVGDDAASRAIWTGESGALGEAKQGAILVECSTLSLDWIRELAELAEKDAFLDSPVTGSRDAAEQGKLRLFVGGDVATLERARRVLEAFSQEISHMGATGSGALLKLVLNMMTAVQGVALAEAMTLAGQGGLNLEQVVSILNNAAPGSPMVKAKAPRMIAHDFEQTDFSLRWMQKDTRYALRAAEEFGVPLFSVATAREVYQIALNLGLGDADFSAVIEALKPRE
jgi:3-hydroxyisobutyrate dehydrogenase